MKVLYDHQCFEMQDFGGISRYFYEIINYFYKNKLIDFKLPIKYSKNHYIKKLDFIKLKNYQNNYDIKLLNNINFKGKSYVYKIIKKTGFLKSISYYNKQLVIKELKNNNFDIFHSTYYDPYFLDYLNKPYVITIHDMIHEKFKDIFPEYNNETIEYKKKSVSNAGRIIAISENTKKDLMELYNISSEKIDVIYHGSSFLNIEKKNCSLKLPDRYILFVGNRNNYKNFLFFLISILPLLKKDKDLYLVCAGGREFVKEELYIFQNLMIEKKILYYKFNDNELYHLYKNALCFVFPSLYEGFGIPILESFSCECPLVLSNTSCFPEIAQDAAEYFDPYDEDSILEAISNVIYDENKRKKLINLGLKRVKDFSWEKTALKTKEVYQKLL